ncbi:inorganic phosphate transporter [Jeongeupia naejangsanensis]|uniref:Phosphate transporter n=1 Tax=Jeongeupia naejangsanensis TaxID=613195 RepID=A0ABS2BIN0_9NEIS|nr:inorganic phosphate transporter [Jeongeupia naejangsanensis]MBM3115469.1 anion permease [Jeongeupia naejangsanensis]
MIEMFSGLSFTVGVSLALALLFVLTFEFINGFHDTANAVATVIYTKAMPAQLAVVASGIFNFLGVMLGGLSVAYAIVHLLPVDLLINVSSVQGLSMVFSLLAAAILWNLGTWYFGLPASSSHTLIGSILGVGLASAFINGGDVATAINWKKAIDIGLSLLVSPTVGFLLAFSLLLLFKRIWATGKMHKTPEGRRAIDGKKHPPFWNRVVLIASAMGVSFAHGSNDGQKGIGLIMLVLIGIVPAKFVLDLNSTTYQIDRTRDAAIHMQQFYERNDDKLGKYMLMKPREINGSEMPKQFHCDFHDTVPAVQTLVSRLEGVKDYSQIKPEERPHIRRLILCLDDTARKVSKLPELSSREVDDLNKLRADLTATTEYSPQWVIVAIALALGLGTMVGWKRVVLTVGEKIGKQGMTYAQGMSAQIVAASSIGIANIFGLPVSTTHVLSSGVAGTMVANKSGLQMSTIRSILLAWVFTLPASMGLAAGLFWTSMKIFG